MKDLKTKGFYTQTVKNTVFLCLDSNLNSFFNSHSVAYGTDPKGILASLLKIFSDSEKNKQKVIIVTHIPLADESAKTQLPKFLKVIFDRFSDIISASLAAHTHNDHFKFYKNLKGENIFMEYISPSLTTFSNLNPSFRVYDVSSEGEIANYFQYRMNLDVMNVYALQDNFDLKFDLIYDLVSQYDLKENNSQKLNFEIRQSRINDLETKIFDVKKFSEIYMQNFYTSYYLGDLSYTEWVSRFAVLKCHAKDDLDLIYDCVSRNSADYVSNFFNRTWRYLFDSSKWYFKKGANPYK